MRRALFDYKTLNILYEINLHKILNLRDAGNRKKGVRHHKKTLVHERCLTPLPLFTQYLPCVSYLALGEAELPKPSGGYEFLPIFSLLKK